MNICKILLICTVFSHTGAEIQMLINPVNLPENLLPGTQLSRAYDKDVAGKADAYRFLNKTKDFVIDASSGVITATKVFNYETDPIRFLFIVDTGGPMRRVLTINIIDVPEPPDCTADPQFSSGTAALEIDEDYPLFQSIYRVTATDEDLVHGDRLTYTVVTQLSGPEKGANSFGVDAVNGVVSLRGEDILDFDRGYHVFQLTLRATDTAGLLCQGTIIIKIRNINDERPQFEPFPLDSINVTEKTPIGEIVARIRAIDRDGDSITYSFKTQQEMFGLDPSTGIITLLQPLNLDNPNNSKTYSLEIEARDSGNNTGAYTFTVLVESVDDPIFCDSSFLTGVSRSVPEDVPASAFIYMIPSRGPDPGQEVEFLILNSSRNATAYFALDSWNGVISKTIEPRLDYETNPKHFQLVIAVRSRGTRPVEPCTGTVTIHIQNVNDESPVLTYVPDAPVHIYENVPVGTKLVTLTAADGDREDSVHYEFIGTRREFFINEDSGEVSIAYPLDYEDVGTPKSWVLRVRAYDNQRAHSTTGTFTVILQDVNDNPPQCSRDIYTIELAEDTPVETLLVSLACTDKDGTFPNNNITYHLITDPFSKETFTLTNNELKVGPKHLDSDNAIFAGMHFKYTLFVKVSDEGSPVLSTIITVIVRVIRINEMNPIGTTSEFTFSILENCPVDTLVGKLTFTDADWPFNNLKYTIVGGQLGTPPKFYMEPYTGMIKLLDSLDRETESWYKIVVRITDLDNDAVPDSLRQRSATAQVTVKVLNVNDEPPVCHPPHLETRIYSTVKGPFIQLNCSDRDSPQEHLSYLIVGGNTNNLFTLQRRGVDPPSLATGQNFQYDVFQGIQDPVTFQLLIEVTDELGGNKAGQLSATSTIIIHVLPWTMTQPTSSTKTALTTITTAVLRKISYYWTPDNWFPAVLTLTATLLLMCLYALAWCLFKDVPACSRLFPHCHKSGQSNLTTKEPGLVPRHGNSLSKDPKPSIKLNFLPGNHQAIRDKDGQQQNCNIRSLQPRVRFSSVRVRKEITPRLWLSDQLQQKYVSCWHPHLKTRPSSWLLILVSHYPHVQLVCQLSVTNPVGPGLQEAVTPEILNDDVTHQQIPYYCVKPSQQHTERTTHCDRVGCVLGAAPVCTRVSAKLCSSRVGDKGCTLPTVDVDEASDKIQHIFMEHNSVTCSCRGSKLVAGVRAREISQEKEIKEAQTLCRVPNVSCHLRGWDSDPTKRALVFCSLKAPHLSEDSGILTRITWGPLSQQPVLSVSDPILTLHRQYHTIQAFTQQAFSEGSVAGVPPSPDVCDRSVARTSDPITPCTSLTAPAFIPGVFRSHSLTLLSHSSLGVASLQGCPHPMTQDTTTRRKVHSAPSLGLSGGKGCWAGSEAETTRRAAQQSNAV
ncbi:cadherin EGF LAG seven-pass G-type receptor 1-like [Erethizon dorsatum]